jgi:citrate lyase subunit beta/citryl-CoA lyase
MRLPRSYLFVPADRPERITKALASGADAVIADLEDAVAPGAKLAARQALRSALEEVHALRCSLIVRINGIDTPWFDDDLRAIDHPAVAAVMLPKADSAQAVQAVRDFGGERPVLALVETARGLSSARTLAQTPGVQRLVFGSIDFMLDIDIAEDDGVSLQPYRAELVLASRLGGLPPPVDGVTTVLDHVETIAADARRARALGFGAKLCIHPRQVVPVHAAFSPSAEQIAWARRIVAASAQGAAVAVDGKMVDAPVLARAQRVLAAGAATC